MKVYSTLDVRLYLHMPTESGEVLVLTYSRFTYCDDVGLA
jgi:hypothetical protein